MATRSASWGRPGSGDGGTDAVFAPGPVHEAGLRRMRDAGVTLVHTKGVYYEWVRTLDAARGFERDHPELTDPPGFSL